MTSKDREHLDEKETDKFYIMKNERYSCPDCGGALTRGPCGGLSENFYCNMCGSKFNETPFFVERINNTCNASNQVIELSHQFDRDKLSFALSWFADRADNRAKLNVVNRNFENTKDALNRRNFFAKLALEKYGILVYE